MQIVTLPLQRAAVGFFDRTDRVWRFLGSALLCCGVLAVGFTLARAPLTLCLILVMVAMGGVLLLLRPVLGLYLLAFTIPFGSLREFSLGGVTVGLSELLVAGTVSSWLLRAMALRRVRIARSKVVLALFLYLGALIVSLWPAQNFVPALKEIAKWGEFLLLYLFVAAETNPANRLWLVAALFLAGTVEGALGIYQFTYQVGPPGFTLFGRYMRAYGTFLQPNPFGAYMGLLLPLAYATVLTTWRDALALRARRSPGLVWFWLLAALATLVMLAALVMSWSRGALLGLAAGAALVGLALGRRVWPLVALLGIVLLLLAPRLTSAVPTDVMARLTETVEYAGQDLTSVEITDENFSVVERAAHWEAAWRMFSSRPWLGVGTGQYATVYPSVAIARWEDPLGHAHNYYLNVLAEGGLVGLAAYVAVMLAAISAVWRSARKETGWRRALALGALGMFGHLLAHSAFDNLYVHEMYLLVAMVLGLVAWPRTQPATRSREQLSVQMPLAGQ